MRLLVYYISLRTLLLLNSNLSAIFQYSPAVSVFLPMGSPAGTAMGMPDLSPGCGARAGVRIPSQSI